MGTAALVFAFIFDRIWTVIVWIVAGGIAGAISDRVVQRNQLGCLGNVAIGVVGGLVFGFLVDRLFDIKIEGFFWTFIAALIGSALLLVIINWVTRGRGIGRQRR